MGKAETDALLAVWRRDRNLRRQVVQSLPQVRERRVSLNGGRCYETSKRALKVAIVAPPWFEIPPRGYGGIEWMCYWLAEGLVAAGHDVTVIGAGRKHTSARFVATFPEPPTAKLGEPSLDFLHAAKAARILESLRPDVVHDHTQAGPLVAPGREIPTVVTVHGPANGDSAGYYRALNSSVSLVAISESQRRAASRLHWASTIHNAIPVHAYPFQSVKEEFALFLGRMSPEKSPHLAIDAAREAGVPIVLAAKRNEIAEHRYFEAEIRPRLGSDTEWIGEADAATKKDLLARARCLAFPIQWTEPFGIVMVEALACGTPVVALRRGSVGEVVVDGVTGFICDKPGELAEAIRKADQIDPAACRGEAKLRFDISRMVLDYEKVYQQALQRRKTAVRAMDSCHSL